MCGGGGEPFIIPYVNLFAIAHSTSSSLSNDFHVVENASPGVGRIRAKRCTKDVTEREVTRFGNIILIRKRRTIIFPTKSV